MWWRCGLNLALRAMFLSERLARIRNGFSQYFHLGLDCISE